MDVLKFSCAGSPLNLDIPDIKTVVVYQSFLAFFLLQKRHFFRIKNKESGHFMSIQGGVEEMKSGRVVVAPQVEPMSDIWFYQDGLLKSKVPRG